MSLYIYWRLSLGKAITTNIYLQLTDRIIKKPEGIMEDVLVKARNFIFSVDFVVLDFEEDEDMPLILRMPFMYMAKVIIDFFEGTLTLRVGEKVISLMFTKA